MSRSTRVDGWVRHWAQRQPEKPALICGKQTISYAELERRTERVSHWLQTLGVARGDRVAVLLRNGPEFLELYLACARLRAVFVPLNCRCAAGELAYFLENSAPAVLVADAEFGAVLSADDTALVRRTTDTAWVGLAAGVTGRNYRAETAALDGSGPRAEADSPVWDPEEAQLILYTSGTTGRPKGAVLPHRKTFFNCLNAMLFFDLSHADVMLVALPLYHSGGLLIQATPAFYAGLTVVLHRRFHAPAVFADVERYRVTTFLGVPTAYRALLGVSPQQRKGLESLRVCAIGGEKSDPALVEMCNRAGFPLRELMGQTETSILLWASEEDLLRHPGSVGRPVFHAEVEVHDPDGEPVEPGEVGEIVVRGPVRMSGYWRDPARTREVFRGEWLRTGDLARQDREGHFFLVDRLRDMYISGGENVYTAEVEHVLVEHPDVADAAVVGVDHPQWGQVGHAFVVPRARSLVDEVELAAFCSVRLATYKCPKQFVFRDSLPRTSLGKVHKVALVAPSGVTGSHGKGGDS